MENPIKISSSTSRRGQYFARVARQCDLQSQHKQMTFELTGTAAQCFGAAKAGQFIQIACRDLRDARSLMPLLRRPFSIAAVHPDKKNHEHILVEIIYRLLGPGTGWLAHRNTGEEINLLGPLGNGFTLAKRPQGQALLIGGGVGLPPLFFLAQQLAQMDRMEIVGFAGARSRDQFAGTLSLDHYQAQQPLKPQMIMEQFTRSSTGCIIATDDGSCGFRGSIVDALDNYLNQQTILEDVQVFACGPDAMLKAIVELSQSRNLPCQICMEAYMACGIGLCQSCVVQVRNESGRTKISDIGPYYKLACSNGPVFDAQTVIWE